jgi:hypothetical protein
MELNPCQIEPHGVIFNTWGYIWRTNYHTVNTGDKDSNFEKTIVLWIKFYTTQIPFYEKSDNKETIEVSDGESERSE